ncbi:UNVERIFIED_CONTAM: hypothetical protein K2H54_026253 [Gekko kuhli]
MVQLTDKGRIRSVSTRKSSNDKQPRSKDSWTEQYRLRLHHEIRETILCTVHPVSLLIWREAADSESRLQTIRIDNATT